MFPHSPHIPPSRDVEAAKRDSSCSEPATQPVRHHHRERDFGIGYGNSSGYGREEHFAQPPWGPDRFRCV